MRWGAAAARDVAELHRMATDVAADAWRGHAYYSGDLEVLAGRLRAIGARLRPEAALPGPYGAAEIADGLYGDIGLGSVLRGSELRHLAWQIRRVAWEEEVLLYPWAAPEAPPSEDGGVRLVGILYGVLAASTAASAQQMAALGRRPQWPGPAGGTAA